MHALGQITFTMTVSMHMCLPGCRCPAEMILDEPAATETTWNSEAEGLEMCSLPVEVGTTCIVVRGQCTVQRKDSE